MLSTMQSMRDGLFPAVGAGAFAEDWLSHVHFPLGYVLKTNTP
jgi:hypothetical protein